MAVTLQMNATELAEVTKQSEEIDRLRLDLQRATIERDLLRSILTDAARPLSNTAITAVAISEAQYPPMTVSEIEERMMWEYEHEGTWYRSFNSQAEATEHADANCPPGTILPSFYMVPGLRP